MALLDVNRPKDKPFRIYPELPAHIHEKLRTRAKKHLRTIKSEVEAIVYAAIEADDHDARQWPQELERK